MCELREMARELEQLAGNAGASPASSSSAARRRWSDAWMVGEKAGTRALRAEAMALVGALLAQLQHCAKARTLKSTAAAASLRASGSGSDSGCADEDRTMAMAAAATTADSSESSTPCSVAVVYLPLPPVAASSPTSPPLLPVQDVTIGAQVTSGAKSMRKNTIEDVQVVVGAAGDGVGCGISGDAAAGGASVTWQSNAQHRIRACSPPGSPRGGHGGARTPPLAVGATPPPRIHRRTTSVTNI
eukprot:SAG11_NODE_2347_length_3487_cov_1.303129_4_plen_244_part_00